jgi:glutathione-regulated potassium-efflux system ancillary protein KefC
VVATAALMQSVGLSMALGAFLAGVLLAESEYRRELETDLEPFKGLLLGLFFIAVGMSIDFAVVLAQAGAGGRRGAGLPAAEGRWCCGPWRARCPLPLAERPVFVILLAQGGEFGFVVFQAALGGGVIGAEASSLLVAAVALSMLLTPLLLVATDRWLAPRLASRASPDQPAEIAEPQHAPVIICGFGRYGQIVGRLLNANGLSATVLDHSVKTSPACAASAGRPSTATPRGWTCCAWPAPRGARHRGGHRRRGTEPGRGRPGAPALPAGHPGGARAQRHALVRAAGAGVTHRTRDARSALMSGRSVLELMGMAAARGAHAGLRFRRHSIELLQQMAPHQGDEKKLIARGQAGPAQLEELWRANARNVPQRQTGAARLCRPDQARPSQSSLQPVSSMPR